MNLKIAFKTNKNNQTILLQAAQVEDTLPDHEHIKFATSQGSVSATIPKSSLKKVSDDLWFLEDPERYITLPDGASEPLAQAHVFPVIEEHVTVHKEIHKTGTVQVNQKVVQTNEAVAYDLTKEHVEIEKIPVGRKLDDGEEVHPQRLSDGTLVIPVVEERVVLTKIRILTEEIRVTKHKEIQSCVESIPLRKTRLHIQKTDAF